MTNDEFVDVGCEMDLIDSELYPFDEKELELYRALDALAEKVIYENGDISFEPEEGYEDDLFDPDSAHLGMEIGIQIMSMSLFEAIVKYSRNNDDDYLINHCLN